MPGSELIDDLLRDYHVKRPQILQRLDEFKRTFEKGDAAIFEELCYCILTAGNSATMGLRGIDALRDLLLEGSEKELRTRARAHQLRFWRLRPAYIVQTREYLRAECGLQLKKLLLSFRTRLDRRDFFAANQNIKGLGYKESSHFLRNVGFGGYAILDIHILRSMHELGVMDAQVRTNARKNYLFAEKELRAFAGSIRVPMDHLDLLLWSRRTGQILK